ncbi:hypothetical protein F5J12DRAFT_782828 [Pisolithus orientalis]|uniref:uncharacterized protein n=1 Tax=Pisolithus orientalis TaxID=936130 RepID=UPI00222575CF|nr:uncharacterized protein F5J12DRAFT_782828 [Pisolithus orientalis]KAI6006559.1 hypothetical protein F5J12DRAFT_782828 [Pisolithus orientalis]
MASSDYESDSFSNNTEPSLPQKGTSLQLAEIEILEAKLESWKNANQNKRSSIMLTLRNKIKNLDANVMLKMHEWVQKKKAIQTWLYIHSWSCSQQALIKYGGGWTLRKVVMHHQKKSINKVLEEAGIKQGSAEMIKSYQKAVNTVMKSLTAEEIQEAKALATEWNERQPPWDVQSETTEKKGHKYAEEFAKEMWKHHGARVVVMAAWEDADGEILTNSSRHDFNDELGNGKLFEELDECWDKFLKQRKSNGKPKTILPVSDNGTPYILNILDMQAPKLKDIMQTFVTFHYHMEGLQEFTEQHPNNIFGFKKWRDAGGSLQMPVAVANSSGVRMGVKQDLDGSPDHLAGKRAMDRMMQGRRKKNDGTGTSMVDEDAAKAVALLDAKWLRVTPASQLEPPHAWWQVVGSNSSPVQPMPEGHHTDSPDSLQLADPLAVPTTIKRAHKQEDSKCKLPIPSMIPMHQTSIDNARGMWQSKWVQKAPKQPDDNVTTPSPSKKCRQC